MNINIALTLGGVMAILVGMALGYLIRLLISVSKRGTVEFETKQVLLSAKEAVQKMHEESEKRTESREKELRTKEKEADIRFKKIEERLGKKEEFLDVRQLDINKELEHIKEKSIELEVVHNKLLKEKGDSVHELERIANLSTEEAKGEILERIEKIYQEDFLLRLKKLETEGEEKLKHVASDILATSIQRLATSTAAEMMITNVQIPSDEIKGRVIGKEGRNIRTLERVAGVEIIIDDTPGSIVISSFDPIRRQIARIALEKLIEDGRIQPAKIEEAVEKAREEIGKVIKEKGELAAYECGVFNLDQRVTLLLGRLHFRTSFGQNVLQHSIEMAHLAGMIAEELGANVAVAKAGALLHDIGKAVDHEVQGTHVEIGRRILQKFEVAPEIIQAMQSHHEEYPYETIESIIVQTADAISGGRPGARRDSAERYIKRLEDLEGIANSFPAVEKTYAIQAGRELRVFVKPEQITDLEAKNLAREIALRVEKELKYPGEIKISVIRESRTIEYAR